MGVLLQITPCTESQWNGPRVSGQLHAKTAAASPHWRESVHLDLGSTAEFGRMAIYMIDHRGSSTGYIVAPRIEPYHVNLNPDPYGGERYKAIARNGCQAIRLRKLEGRPRRSQQSEYTIATQYTTYEYL